MKDINILADTNLHLIKEKPDGTYTQYLSDTELYLCSGYDNTDNIVVLNEEEAYHCLKVMRNKIGDKIHITDGLGNIFSGEIIEKKEKKENGKKYKYEVRCQKLLTYHYDDVFFNLFFCFPLMKNLERLEFAHEKAIELGITNFCFYNAENSYKRTFPVNRFEKLSIVAMKQCLRSKLPKLYFMNTLNEVLNSDGIKILFDQNAEKSFTDYISNINLPVQQATYFIFGPEAGFSKKEMKLFNENNKILKCHLTKNRLRTETAVVLAAGLISTSIK